MSNWIKVDQERPKDNTKVLVAIISNNYRGVHFAYYDGLSFYVLDEKGNHDQFIIAWQELPNIDEL